MSINLILTTSGFALPETSLYEPVSDKLIATPSILSRNIDLGKNDKLIEVSKSDTIYTSPVANAAYKDYIASPIFDNYIKMIDIASEILSKAPLSTFLEVQANNKNLSPTSFMLCLDIAKDTFLSNYAQYVSYPLSSRLVTDSSITHSVIDSNLNKIRALQPYQLNTSWQCLLADIVINKEAFLVLFKHVFVDQY